MIKSEPDPDSFWVFKKTRNGFESGLGFYKNPARTRTQPDPVKYICIVTKIPSYIYIDKTLKYLTLTISSDFSRFSSLSLQLTTLIHSPLPLSLTLLSCLTPSTTNCQPRLSHALSLSVSLSLPKKTKTKI